MNRSFSKLLLNRFDRFVRVLNLSKICVFRIALDMQVLLHSWFIGLCRFPPIILHFYPIFSLNFPSIFVKGIM